MGARVVVLTDMIDVLPWLQVNVDANLPVASSDCCFRMAELDWNTARLKDLGLEEGAEPDLLLAADVVYGLEAAKPLAEAIRALVSSSKTRVLIGHSSQIQSVWDVFV